MRETSGEIESAATAWAARMDREPLDPVETRALETWLAGDTRRIGALMRARAVLALVDVGRPSENEALLRSARSDRSSWLSRRALMAGGTAMAAAAAGVAVFFSEPRHYETGVGEVLLVPLEDGSAATLSTASRIEVHFTERQRRVHLVRGEALFEVAKDAARPFLVSAATSEVQAIGTAFVVRMQNSRHLRVMVQEGVVELKTVGADRPFRMIAGMQADERAGKPVHLSELPSEEVDRQLVWRQGKLSFNGETLAEAAEEFNRYNETPIIVADDGAANKTVTGMFAATNPAGFAEAVSLAFGVHAKIGSDRIILSSTAIPATA